MENRDQILDSFTPCKIREGLRAKCLNRFFVPALEPKLRYTFDVGCLWSGRLEVGTAAFYKAFFVYVGRPNNFQHRRLLWPDGHAAQPQPPPPAQQCTNHAKFSDNDITTNFRNLHTISGTQVTCTAARRPQGPHYLTIMKPPLNLPLKMAEWQ